MTQPEQRLRLGAAAALAAALACPAFAAERADDLVRTVRERAAGLGISAEALAPTIGAIQAAADKGLPADLVADKVLEGLAKGVPPTRLADAAADLEARLESAETIVTAAARGVPEDEQRVAIAKVAAELGVARDPKPFLDLAEAARNSDLSAFMVAARTLTDLTGHGVPEPAAAAALVLLIRGEYAPAEIAGVVTLFDSYKREGGRDPVPFLDEVKARATRRASLRDIVNTFGDRATPLNRTASPTLNGLDLAPGEKAPQGETALEQLSNGRAGESPSVGTPSQLRQQSKP